jgi:hypothetical protein
LDQEEDPDAPAVKQLDEEEWGKAEPFEVMNPCNRGSGKAVAKRLSHVLSMPIKKPSKFN